MKQLMKLAAAAALGATCVRHDRLCAGRLVPSRPRRASRSTAQLPGSRSPCSSGSPRQNRAAQAAGVPVGQLYAHTDGDSWDYLAIDPVTTPAQDAAVDAAAKKMGHAGRRRQHRSSSANISSMHTDTFAIGPVTPAQYLALAGQ